MRPLVGLQFAEHMKTVMAAERLRELAANFESHRGFQFLKGKPKDIANPLVRIGGLRDDFQIANACAD